jgi:hypothetical protein
MNRDEIRSLSHALFGNADRLTAAAAIGRLAGKPISAMAVAEESGLGYNRAQEQVAHFKRANLLIPDADSGLRRKDYRTVELSYWNSAVRLLDELISLDDL